jgi:acetolactate decarboxylase
MKLIQCFAVAATLLCGNAGAQEIVPADITISGAMRNVMRKGELFATIQLDTIRDSKHLYGMGPVEYLKGELLVVDGHGYKAVVADSQHMRVTETLNVGAPFFGYTRVENWQAVELPETVHTLSDLEQLLLHSVGNMAGPFFFKIEGAVDSASIHLVNLPNGTKVNSPETAHQGQINYPVTHRQATLIGFFSTDHKTIFTHHTTFQHIHLITHDKQLMGHLDYLNLKQGKLWVAVK